MGRLKTFIMCDIINLILLNDNIFLLAYLKSIFNVNHMELDISINF